MFKRKIYNQLLKWKEESKGESALLIEGARRIGKTSIAEEFGKNLFPSFKTIDFSKVSDDVKKAFIDVSDMDRFFEKLFLSLGMSPLPRGSLIILDEIQFCPKARQAIKSLVEDKRYYYLETGISDYEAEMLRVTAGMLDEYDLPKGSELVVIEDEG